MIHYHGLPMTPLADMLRAMRGKHAMVSYSDFRQIEEAAEICQSIVIDCGTFGAWLRGEQPDFVGYEAFVGKWLKHPAVDWVIIPDVIDGNEAKNDALIWSWPFPTAVSVPVFHLHESMKRLEFLCARFPRVALGSSGEFADPGTPRWWNRIAEIMEVVCDENGLPRVKLHGLRMLDPVLFSHLPLSSADSCNVARNIGIDSAWNGTYTPRSKWARAIVMMDRIEHHASAHRWCNRSSGVQQNMELLG